MTTFGNFNKNENGNDVSPRDLGAVPPNFRNIANLYLSCPRKFLVDTSEIFSVDELYDKPLGFNLSVFERYIEECVDFSLPRDVYKLEFEKKLNQCRKWMKVGPGLGLFTEYCSFERFTKDNRLSYLFLGLDRLVATVVAAHLIDISEGLKDLKDVGIENRVLYPAARKSYFIVIRGRKFKVSRDTFYSYEGKVAFGEHGMVKYNARFKERKLQAQGLEVESQGFFQSCTEIVNGIQVVVRVLSVIGGRVDENNNHTTSPQSPPSPLELLHSKALPLVRLLIDVLNCIKTGATMWNVINLLISAYEVIVLGYNSVRAQSLDLVLISALSTLLPKQLFEIVKRMAMLSSAKILDDAGIFCNVMNCVINFFMVLCKSIPGGDKIAEMLSLLPFGEHYRAYDHMERLVKSWKKDKTVIMNSQFRETVKDVEVLSRSTSFLEWIRRSNAVKTLYEDFKGLSKAVKSYDSIRRVEPVCIAFEGKPGVFKSVKLNQLVDAMRRDKKDPRTVYSHSIRSIKDGKDFYDIYNNESIFVMDDLGQQGNSQFRNLINWVSEVKYPLECAEAHLKNTKFFNSELILFTTNKFTTITGFTKDDCIAEKDALFRRAHVFNFDEVMRREGRLYGVLRFLWYDYAGKNKEWKNTPYPDCNFPTSLVLTGDRIEMLVWMRKWIRFLEDQKKEFNGRNDLSEEEVETINAQMFFDSGYDDGDEMEVSGVNELEVNPHEVWFEADEPLVSGGSFSWLDILIKRVYEFLCPIAFNLLDKSTLSMGTMIGAALLGITIAFKTGLVKYKVTREVEAQSICRVLVDTARGLPDLDRPSTSIEAVQRGTKFAIIHGEVDVHVMVICSGHHFIVPFHSTRAEEIVVTIFSDASATQRVFDHSIAKCVWSNEKEDVCVYTFNQHIATPLKNLAAHVSLGGKATVLVIPGKNVGLDTISSPSDDFIYTRKSIKGDVLYKNHLSRNQTVVYQYGGNGLCGSPICDKQTGILGFHVAGSGTSLGVSIVWSLSTRQRIRSIIEPDSRYILPCGMRNSEDERSGVLLDVDYSVSVPRESSIRPSPLAGLLKCSKAPANLNVHGPKTVEILGSSSFQSVGYVEPADLNFAKEWVFSLMRPFKPLTMEEVIGGNDRLAGLNKDSSNGFGLVNDKNIYVDFKKKCLTPLGQSEYTRFKQTLLSGDLDMKDILWKECLKDELRDSAKVDNPRTFRCSTLWVQLLTKEVFGNFVADVQDEKWATGIMIGINPLKDWPQLYDQFKYCEEKWGGDFKQWDKKMLTQLQEAMAECFDSFYMDEEQRIYGSFLLINLAHSLVLLRNKTFLSTHSFPSGSWLTAFVNSVINRMMTACWYSNTMRSAGRRVLLSNFLRDVKDAVYGDDKLTGVMKDSDVLNMETMAKYFISLGLGFTNSKKGVAVGRGESWNDITFLKRSFVFRPEFDKIVCPLDKATIYSSLSWYDSTKDMTVVMDGKINAFQREAFLHYDYELMMSDLKNAINDARMEEKVFLTPAQMTYLVLRSDEQYCMKSYNVYASM